MENAVQENISFKNVWDSIFNELPKTNIINDSDDSDILRISIIIEALYKEFQNFVSSFKNKTCTCKTYSKTSLTNFHDTSINTVTNLEKNLNDQTIRSIDTSLFDSEDDNSFVMNKEQKSPSLKSKYKPIKYNKLKKVRTLQLNKTINKNKQDEYKNNDTLDSDSIIFESPECRATRNKILTNPLPKSKKTATQFRSISNESILCETKKLNSPDDKRKSADETLFILPSQKSDEAETFYVFPTEPCNITDKVVKESNVDSKIKNDNVNGQTNQQTQYINLEAVLNDLVNDSTPKEKKKKDNFDFVKKIEEEDDGPVRTKAKRMKLEGWACNECKEFYEMFGEEKNMKEVMNKCSRHRNKRQQIYQTPIDYWKPDFSKDF